MTFNEIEAKNTTVTGNETSATKTDLRPYLQFLRTDLERAFRDRDWESLLKQLEQLAAVGESEGRRELCLRAQSLREVLGHRAGGRGEEPGETLLRHFHELTFHLTHLQWTTN
jgi:hypothetical protein